MHTPQVPELEIVPTVEAEAAAMGAAVLVFLPGLLDITRLQVSVKLVQSVLYLAPALQRLSAGAVA